MTSWRARLLAGAVRRCAGPLRLLGVDPHELSLLLEARLTLEHRRFGGGSNPLLSLRDAVQTLLAILAAHVSIALGAAAFLLDDPFVWMVALQSLLTLLVATVVLTTHLPLLFEVDDIAIIQPLPVGERSYLAVRSLSVALSLGVLVVALVGPASLIAAAAYRSPLVVPLVVIGSAGTTVTTVAGIVAVVVAAVRFARPERARDVLVRTQLVAVALVLGAVYVGAPLADRLGVEATLAAEPRLWAWYPPALPAGLLRLALDGGQRGDGLLAVLAALVPLAALGVARLLTGPGLLVGLAAAATRSGRARRGPRFRPMLAALVTTGGAERAGYEFVAAVARTERQFRMAVGGTLVVVLLPAAWLAVARGPGVAALRFAPYAAALVVVVAVEAMRTSENWRARTVFLAIDGETRGEFVRGAARRLLTRYVAVPGAIAIVATLALASSRAGAGALGASAAALALGTGCVRRALDRVPFTDAPDTPRSVAELLTAFAIALLVYVAAAVHAAATFVPRAEVALAVAWVVAAAVALRRFRRWRPSVPPVSTAGGDGAPV